MWMDHMVVEMLSNVTLTSEQQDVGANCDVSLSRLFSVSTQMYSIWSFENSS